MAKRDSTIGIVIARTLFCAVLVLMFLLTGVYLLERPADNQTTLNVGPISITTDSIAVVCIVAATVVGIFGITPLGWRFLVGKTRPDSTVPSDGVRPQTNGITAEERAYLIVAADMIIDPIIHRLDVCGPEMKDEAHPRRYYKRHRDELRRVYAFAKQLGGTFCLAEAANKFGRLFEEVHLEIARVVNNLATKSKELNEFIRKTGSREKPEIDEQFEAVFTRIGGDLENLAEELRQLHQRVRAKLM